MKKIKFSVVLIAIAFLFSACSGVNRYGIDEGALDFELRSVEKDICLPVVRDYLNATDYETQFVALKAMTDSGADRQVAEILLKIPKDGAAPYSFFISSSEDFAEYTVSEIEIDGKTEAGEYTLGYAIEKNLVPGNEYFWKMTDKNGKIADYGKIAVKDAPVRFINVDNVRNVRDIGGWTGEGGKKVSYGLVYRGTRLNGNTDGSLLLSEKGKAVMRDELGVMTEIDLRAETDSSGIDNTVQNSCFFAEIVKGKKDRNYLKCAIGQYDWITGYNSCVLLKRIFYYLTDERNYPIYIHCNAGADRTGTVVFLLNGLLGVSFEDLTRDFELTSTYSARWRSAGEDAFEGTGVNASGTYLPGGTGNYVSFGELYDAMMEFSEDGTLKNGIENFLIQKVEIQESHIEKIRSIFLK